MRKETQALAAMLAPMGAEERIPLAKHTSFRIGGPADLLFAPQSREELRFALEQAKALGVPVALMGNGTNLLVRDGGVEGLVLKLGPGFSAIQPLGEGRITAQAGALLSSLANEAAAQGLMGLEWAAGIPGSVGGALAMNAGAYGGEIKDVLTSIEYWDMETGEMIERPPADGELGYRESAFSWPRRIALSATVSLAPDDGHMLERMRDYSRRRREKQPLQYPSGGSTFKRPQGHFAGALIEGAGLKGTAVGGAQVSRLHAGFIINRGGATCQDVLDLIALVQRRVWEHSGVKLEPEIRVIGRDEP